MIGALWCYAYWLSREAELSYTDTIQLSGLSAPVFVKFGPHAIPYMRADSQPDLFFAQGYVMAAERMWQMDLMRRVARGLLAEVFGEKALSLDRLFRTLGFEAIARRNLAALSPQGRRILKAYAMGVNAYRKLSETRLPLEYRIAGFTPASWSPIDSLAIAEYMAFLLSFNVKEEVVYLRLEKRLNKERLLELFPTDEGIPAPAYALNLPDYTVSEVDPFEIYSKYAASYGLPMPGPASNSWALTGTRTGDGSPLLANDPHLMPSTPGIWYELELEAPGYHVAGTALPGLPLVVIGHNEYLAWGLTTAMADTQDIFVERLTPDGRAVIRPGGNTETIVTQLEHIPVKDWKEQYTFTIRSTSKGIILNDILSESRPLPADFVQLKSPCLLALRSNTELPDKAFDGLYLLNIAQTVSSARQGIALIAHGSQNFLLAHRDGTIAWQVSGSLPRRKQGLGTFPVPGWVDDYDWTGFNDTRNNPSSINPLKGFLITANNRTIPIDFPVHVTRSWMPPYRARRIRELLDKSDKHTAQDMIQMQMDRKAVEAEVWIAALRRVVPQLKEIDPNAWTIARDYLLDWDGYFEPESSSAALFVQLRKALFIELFGDELDDDLDAYMRMYMLGYNALQEAMHSGHSSFWDDVRTLEQETPAHIWARSLRIALRELDRQQGTVEQARLDYSRVLVFYHSFHNVPLLGRFFDVGPIGVGGDDHTISAMKTELAFPEKPTFVPTYRYVFTPGDWGQTRGTQTLGQSGHRFSPYRTDQLQDWLEGRTHAWHWGGPPEQEVIGTLVLSPDTTLRIRKEIILTDG